MPSAKAAAREPRGAAAVLLKRLGDERAPVAIRRQIALMVAPAATAVESVFVMLAFSSFGGRAILLALLNVLTLAGVVFGSVPESYALSGAGLAALLWIAGRNEPAAKSTFRGLAAAGVALVGTTTPMLVPFGIAALIVFAHARDDLARLVGRVSLLLTVVGGVTVVSAAAIAALYGTTSEYKNRDFRQLREAPLWSARGTLGRTPVTETAETEARRHLRRATVDLPQALGYTVLAAAPAVDHQLVPPTSRGPETWFTFVATETAWWRVILVLGAMAGAVGIWRTVPSTPRGTMYLVAAALLAYNWIFHTLFGYELFLYAKHWSVPLIFLAGAWLEIPPRHGRLLTIALGVAVVLVALNTWFVVQFMLRAV
jgi:hypothetical protein